MTDNAANQAAVEPEPDESTPPPTPPEPWTPTRVAEWNAYYDVYVAAFVVALAFLGSANRIQAVYSALWTQLDAGRSIAAAGSPIGLGGGTVAAEGRRWVNIPWLFEVISYQIYQAAANVRGEQWGAGALVAVAALIRGLTAWFLLGLRRRGPGLWWTALCVTGALGVILSPEPVETVVINNANNSNEAVRVVVSTVGIQSGGLAGVASVAPEVWGAMFLALELLLLHQAINLGKTNRAYGLIPLFLVWANTDETFAFGLLILAAATLGRVLDERRVKDRAGPPARALGIVLAGSFAATLINPAHIFGVLAAFGVILRSVGLDIGPPSPTTISMFGASFAKLSGSAFARALQIYYGCLVLIGLGSFALNRNRFSWARFLMFATATLIFGLSLVFVAPFSLVFAAVLALNGQEWYHDTLGTEGRLGGGWVVWSTGGRLLTIALIFAAIFRITTGWGGQVGGPRFGFGFDRDDFPFEAADAVAAAPIEGNILNTTLAQGDALAWRVAGKRKAYVDSKAHLYPDEVRDQFEDLRKTLRDDKVETWRPVLDAQKISAVMIQTAGAPLTYAKLMNSPNWTPFYDDGANVMFGRNDSSALPADVAYFQANRLDAEALAYKRPQPVPDWLGTPRFVSQLVDSIFQNRLLGRTQPHVEAARHWLRPATVPAGTTYLPDPAHCLLAIRELRTALSSKPDDFAAYQLLTEVYGTLFTQESALIAGLKPTPENLNAIIRTAPQPRLLAIRFRQLLTAANFALQTLPPARTAADRVDRANLSYNLSQLYLQAGNLDLARERRLEIDARAGEMPEEFFQNQTQLLGELNQRLKQVQAQIDDMTIQRRASPLEKADLARNNGAAGLAIRELEEAEQAGGGQPGVRATLVDLYNDTGQPDKALDVISSMNIDDPFLSSGPGTAGIGTATHRQGMVYYLLGDYRNAVSLWEDRSINQVRNTRLIQAPMAAQALLHGEPVGSTRMFIELPELIARQAEWEFELAMAALEGGGEPAVVAGHFRSALELEPDLAVRPVIAYYLDQLGEAVPPPRDNSTPGTPATEPVAPPTEPTATTPPPGPDTPRRELPADPFQKSRLQ